MGRRMLGKPKGKPPVSLLLCCFPHCPSQEDGWVLPAPRPGRMKVLHPRPIEMQNRLSWQTSPRCACFKGCYPEVPAEHAWSGVHHHGGGARTTWVLVLLVCLKTPGPLFAWLEPFSHSKQCATLFNLGRFLVLGWRGVHAFR